MATAAAAPAPAVTAPARGAAPPFPGNIWRAPLVPVALAATAGIVADRYLALPLVGSLLGVVVGLVAWGIGFACRQRGLPLVYLALAVASLFAAYHHLRHDVYAADDIGNLAADEPRPVRLRGVLEEEPVLLHASPPGSETEALRSFPRGDSTRAVLGVTQARQGDEWAAASGKALLLVADRLPGLRPGDEVGGGLHAGDEVEVVGRLVRPSGPANPGGFDHAGRLRDQRVRAEVLVRRTADGVVRLGRGWPSSFGGLLGAVRAWGQKELRQALPPQQSGVAAALLLGESTAMANPEWEKYVRTGVVHVLAISGQHLAVMGFVLWWGLRLAGVRRRWGACVVAAVLFGYALLVGGNPPVMRSAVTVLAVCGGLLLRRAVLPANSFALAWLAVAALHPADLFTAGCQLSFLSVAVLYWGAGGWFRRDADPLDRLIAESRPAWQRGLRWLGRQIALAYGVTLAIWLAVAPLVAARQHIVSPVGLLIGPVVVLLASVALVAGFLLLLAAAACPPLVPAFAGLTRWGLAGCEGVVTFADAVPLGHVYVGDVPEWWLWVFYAGLLAALTLEEVRRRWRWAALAGVGWLCVGLLSGAARPAPDELRCTFVAVGHGGCTVIETPDGRTLLYDAGAMGGPEVAQRHIAPFLWSRGVRRIDEVFLSHADLDHFNGLVALLDRFAVGQATCTPSFAEKPTAGVRKVLGELERRGVPRRVARAGDRFTAGELTIEVLHPPAKGPDGNENARSMVLLLRHHGHTILLTGDLEGPGLQRAWAVLPTGVDVFMAPHHGSHLVNRPELAGRVRPRVAVACQGPPRGGGRPDPYTAAGGRYLDTWRHGAVTVRSHATGLVVETFRTQERFVVRGGPAP
ncbi:MAG TPA: ComEC/Rec2 family competence protein [Gemmataceae bacterium]|nr:ComEC/Rec2 family competence protein [Gemmataceae bacterium]